MQLSTVKVDRDEATRRFRAYRRAVRDRRCAEDEGMMRAYRALAQGTPVLNLGQALAEGGTASIEHERYGTTGTAEVPLVAIARADTRWCWTSGIARDGSLHLQTQLYPHHRNRRDHLYLPAGTFPADDERTGARGTYGAPGIRSMVPTIPPELRPAGDLARFHILYEAEWELHRDQPPPPTDPALLRHLGGDLWAVIGVWDLTEVEQLVLRGRGLEQRDLGPDVPWGERP